MYYNKLVIGEIEELILKKLIPPNFVRVQDRTKILNIRIVQNFMLYHTAEKNKVIYFKG